MNTDRNTFELDDIHLEVIRKKIKNVHLSVHPPNGRVTVSAPLSMDLETIRLFTISKLGWIRKQRTRFQNQKREAPREYLNRESHYYLGQRYLLKVIKQESMPKVLLKHDYIEIYTRLGSKAKKMEEVLHNWYRQQLHDLLLPYIGQWEEKMNLKVNEICIRKMKTKWGTCNKEAKRIWLNTELAKKSSELIEYVLVHEMVHLLERNHNERFIAYMDKYLPNWKHLRDELNRSELGHVEWEY
jgi:predicted metal-dependent hydrolase